MNQFSASAHAAAELYKDAQLRDGPSESVNEMCAAGVRLRIS